MKHTHRAPQFSLSESSFETKESVQEKCGVIAIRSSDPLRLKKETIKALPTIEHRGSDGTGCVYIGLETAQFHSLLPASVFARRLKKKEAKDAENALLHSRYSTTGEAERSEELQPFLRQTKYGKIGLAFNGNLWNWSTVKEEAQRTGYTLPRKKSLPDGESTDTEMFFYLLSQSKQPTLEKALIHDVFPHLKGAYCLIIGQELPQHDKTKLLIARDPVGFHPLWMGTTRKGDIVVASETCTLDALAIPHANFHEVVPGSLTVFEEDSQRARVYTYGTKTLPKMCSLELLYFERFDSLLCIDELHPKVKRHINMFRKRVGQVVGERVWHDLHKAGYKNLDFVDVIPIPDSGRPFGKGVHNTLKKYGANLNEEAIVLNPDIAKRRSFIASERKRKKTAIKKRKYIRDGFTQGSGKAHHYQYHDIILCDDSMIRGNTFKKCIEEVRSYVEDARSQTKARIHVVLSLPPFVDICPDGIAIKETEELATRKCHAINPSDLTDVNIDKVKEFLGLRSDELLIFGTRNEIRKVFREDLQRCHINPNSRDLCFGCQGETYPDGYPHTPVAA